MTQDNFTNNSSTEEDISQEISNHLEPEENSNNEKLKKGLLIIIILLLFGGTYFYYNFSSSNKQNEDISTLPTNNLKKTKVIKKQPVQDVTDKKQLTNNTINQNEDTNIIKVSNKSAIEKLAMQSVGKSDPFEGLTGKIKSSQTQSKTLANVPNMPSQLPTLKLKSIPNVPFNKNLPSFNNFQLLNNNNSVEIKGFIGNKVIVDVNGITESLNKNESFQDIKVLSINKNNLSAKFKKDNKIINKNMKSLIQVNNKNDLQLRNY